jgi:hypothetical protein
MIELPQPALSLAGFVLARAAWSLSDTDDGELLVPVAVIEQHDGARQLVRFEADTQEEAIIAGRSAMRDASNGAAAWAFAREGAWRKMKSDHPGDVLAIDFWATSMTGVATLTQPFNRGSNGARFRIAGTPTLLVGNSLLSADVASPHIGAIMAAVRAHSVVGELWPTWQ